MHLKEKAGECFRLIVFGHMFILIWKVVLDDSEQHLPWSSCALVQTGSFAPVRLFDLDCVTEVCVTSLFFPPFLFYFAFCWLTALVNVALSVTSFSSLWANGSMCFNMLFLLLMWIKAPAKQLAQSSALASLTGLSEYLFFSHWGEGGGAFWIHGGVFEETRRKKLKTWHPNTWP